MHKILIVEDDPTLMIGLRDNFEDAGFEVLAAADGEKGLELALDAGPDLILLDIMLPKVSGYEICEAVRREGHDMPIVMLTAKGQESDVVRGLELGADDYVKKPFGIRELVARVNAFLRRHRSSEIKVFRFGNCELDRGAHRFRKGGETVKLTAKEYRLLEYLLENAGKALARNSIMNNVWGNSLMVTQRSVDRCVTTLRSKVEDDVRTPRYIKTIRDVGYRFEGELE
ncbi:MAG: response regulator transcription factor [Verrucomicrobiota bacterium]